MAGVIGTIADVASFIGAISLGGGQLINILLLTFLITIVAIFIWYFYRSMSQKDLISLNLNRFNRYEHPVLKKFLAIGLFFLEYLIILPILIMIWFAALSILILLVAPEREIGQVMLITGGLIASIRILAYHREEIARDLAKLFPFIVLAGFLLSPGAFDIVSLSNQIGEIPLILNNIFSFVFFIFAVEFILRVFYTILAYWQSSEDLEKLEKREKKKD